MWLPVVFVCVCALEGTLKMNWSKLTFYYKDVTQPAPDDTESHEAVTTLQDEGVIHPVLTEAACLASPDQGDSLNIHTGMKILNWFR